MGGFDFAVIRDSLPFVWQGFLFSAGLTLFATICGLAFGTLLALARLSGYRWLSLPATVYVNAMRSIPLVMVILWFFLALPLLTGKPVGAERSAFITFAVFEAAYFSEILRAGIQGIPRGQLQAAQALGLAPMQTFRYVVGPQAIRPMLPILLTQVIVLFQDTSLVYAIGAKDMLKAAEISGKNYNRPVEMYVFIGLLYFVICFGLSRLARGWSQGRPAT